MRFVKKPSEGDKLIVYNAAKSTLLSISFIGLYFAILPIFDEVKGFLVFLPALSLTVVRYAKMAIGIFKADYQWMKKNSNRKNGLFFLCLLNLFIMLLMAGSMINYVFFVLLPNGFEGLADLTENCIRMGFESIYYTFTLITTSGNSIISANHPVTKVLEMVEMLAFYLVYGCWLTNLMSND